MKRSTALLAFIGFLGIAISLGQIIDKPEIIITPQAAGDQDTTFNGTGKNRIGFGLGNDQINGMAVQPDGKIVAVGVAADGNSEFGFSIARFNIDGSPDATFDGDGLVVTSSAGNEFLHAVAIQPDGKIVAVGQSVGVGSTDFAVLRFNADGSPDTTFDGDGLAIAAIASGTFPDIARAVAIQPDGKIVVAGVARVLGSPTNDEFAVARFNIDGSLDTTFDGDGRVITAVNGRFDEAQSVAIQPDGKIVAAGSCGTANFDFAVVRYNADGSLDTSFDTDGRVITAISGSTDLAYSVLIQPDNKIVVAGAGTTSTLDFAVARYNADGTLDASFDTDGIVTTAIFSSSDTGRSVAIQPDGKLVVTGFALGTNNDFAAVRYNTNGSLDTSFDGDGRVTTAFVGASNDFANSAVLQSDGKIIASGYTSTADGNDSALVRYNSNGSLDTSFDTDGRVTRPVGNADTEVHACDIQPDGKIVLTGSVRFGSTYSLVTARFNTDGTLDPTFDGDGRVRTFIGTFAGIDQAESMVVQPDGKILVTASTRSGSFDNFALVRYNTDGSLDTTFDGDGKLTTSIVAGNDQPQALAVQPDGKIVVAGRAAVSFFHFALVRYNPNGSLDTTFDLDGIVTTQVGANNAIILGIVIQPDGKIVAGGSGSNGTNIDFAAARYNPDGSPDTSFGSNGIVLTPIFSGDNYAGSIALQQDGKVVLAGRVNNGTGSESGVVRYNIDGSLDTTFGGDGIVTTAVGPGFTESSSLAIQSNGKILVSGWWFPGSFSDYFVARYNADGSLDASSLTAQRADIFGTGGIATVDISGSDLYPYMKLQADGRIVLAGTSGGLFGVSRLQNDLAPTAASASVGGRVVDRLGNPISRAQIEVVNPQTNAALHAKSNSFGYFRIDDLRVGNFYIITVGHKRYRFQQPQLLIELQEDLEDVNFVGDSP